MGDVIFTIMAVLVISTARTDARRYGVRPLRRLASDEELNQPAGRSKTKS